MKKTAADCHRILVEVYGEHALAKRTCQKSFAQFKSSDFGLEDKERPGQPKKFEIGFHINSSRETFKGGFACPKCCWNDTKRSHFCIGLLLMMKNGCAVL